MSTIIAEDGYEWPAKLIYNPEKGTITWRREMKEQKHKKEMKKPKKERHMDEKEDMKLMKKKIKKDCMK